MTDWPPPPPEGMGTPVEIWRPKEPPVFGAVTAMAAAVGAVALAVSGAWVPAGFAAAVAGVSGIKFGRWAREWWRFRRSMYPNG